MPTFYFRGPGFVLVMQSLGHSGVDESNHIPSDPLGGRGENPGLWLQPSYGGHLGDAAVY